MAVRIKKEDLINDTQMKEFNDVLEIERVVLARVEHRTGIFHPSGWYSHWENDVFIDVPESINSFASPFEPKIFLVPPQLLGRHEATFGDPLSLDSAGFSKIDFSHGWSGPAIAVASVSFDPGATLNYGDIMILDGHYRSAKAIAEGFTYIPVQFFPFPGDPRLILSTWQPDGKVLTADEVFSVARDSRTVFETKRTKFGVLCLDNVIRRISSTQPSVNVPRSTLLW